MLLLETGITNQEQETVIKSLDCDLDSAAENVLCGHKKNKRVKFPTALAGCHDTNGTLGFYAGDCRGGKKEDDWMETL